MATDFPTGLDALTNPTATDYLNSPSHAGQHANANDAIEALEAKLGINSSAVTTSHDYKLSLVTGTAKALPDSYLDTDGTLTANSDTKLATQKATKTYVDNNGGVDWKAYSAVIPTRASADDPTYVLTFAGVDLTSILNVGKKIKWTQNGTVRYGFITTIAFSTNTTVTIYGGTDYDVLDTATYPISAFHYSSYKSPIGFPMNPTKWTVESVNTGSTNQNSPSASTWYNPGSINIVIPIGLWKVSYKVTLGSNKSGGTVLDLSATLSTANNSVSDVDFTTEIYESHTAGELNYFIIPVFVEKYLELAAKSTRYLNCKTRQSSVTQIGFRGDMGKTILRAVCAYL